MLGPGLLPLVLRATTTVVVTWEHTNLCTALKLSGDRGFPTALAVLDASLTADLSGQAARGHTLSWYPLDLQPRVDDAHPTLVCVRQQEFGLVV